MMKQGSYSAPRLGNSLPLKHTDRSDGSDDRSTDSIVDYLEACRRTARIASFENGRVYPRHVASSEAYLAATSRAAAEAAFAFGHFRVLLRQRQLVADGIPIPLGTRAFDLLIVLLEADGSLVTKDELLSRVWPGIVVTEENLKVQIAPLRKVLGKYRDFIRTEFGRGYRFTANVSSTVARNACRRAPRGRHRPNHRRIPYCISQHRSHD